MNKDFLKQIPAEEQPVASKLNSLVETMQPSEAFQWDLENQLMEKAVTSRPRENSLERFMVPVGWGIAAITGILLLNWSIRSFAPNSSPAAGITATQEVSFAENVRAGYICMDPIALAHGFDVFVTNEDKTGFIRLDEEKRLGEVRSFAWLPDGEQLALIGNTTGSGNVLVTNPVGGELEYLLSNSEVGYLRDASWSRDGRQIVLWSSQNLNTLYVLNANGQVLVEKQMDFQILGTPQFTPDGRGIMFYGADTTTAGLFTMTLEGSQPVLLIPSVENESPLAFSPDGSLLAYIEYDRNEGEARLSTQNLSTGEYSLLGTLPIPKGSGAALPETANLSWSADGKFLVFDFGRNALDHAIYLAPTDGTGLVKLVDSAYAPTISADGKCLAYIHENQVFLMELTRITSPTPTSIRLAVLPTGRGIPNTHQDKLQWKP